MLVIIDDPLRLQDMNLIKYSTSRTTYGKSHLSSDVEWFTVLVQQCVDDLNKKNWVLLYSGIVKLKAFSQRLLELSIEGLFIHEWIQIVIQQWKTRMQKTSLIFMHKSHRLGKAFKKALFFYVRWLCKTHTHKHKQNLPTHRRPQMLHTTCAKWEAMK